MEQDILRTLLELVSSRRFGKYRGKVTGNEDPTKRGRLKVSVPAVLGKQEVWAMPCVPYAGPGVGFLSLPPVDAGVWVEFEGGDPSFPIWAGCFWADDEAPEGGKPTVKTWKTDSLTVRLDDDAPELTLEIKDGAKTTMGNDVVTEAGDAKHTVASDGITSELGSSKVEVKSSAVTVNNGALEVT